MKKSLGIIEVVGLANAINVADTMVKTANIDISNIEITNGMGYVTVKILGDVAAVKAAISSAKMATINDNSYVSSLVIARPTEKIGEIFVNSLIESKEKREPQKEIVEEIKVEETKLEVEKEKKEEIKNDKKNKKIKK